MRDILGAIAHARAQMLMRGYEPLRLDIGRAMLRDLQGQLWPFDATERNPRGEGEILGMPITERDDFEGFCVVPAWTD